MSITLSKPVQLSHLDAVNYILSVAGEMRVSRVKENARSVLVESVLAAVSTEVQSKGWEFCTDVNQRLVPTNTGIITLASNVLSFYPAGESYDQDIILRDGRLYNRTTNSAVFSEPIYLDIVRAVAFDDLPQQAAWLITLTAALQYLSAEYPNNPSIVTLNSLHELAQQELVRYDGRRTYNRISSAVLEGKGRLSKLEAVNVVLTTSGSPPVRVLRGSPDAIRAEHMLLAELRRFLSEGWNFCVDRAQTLTPGAGDRIAVGDNILSLVPVRSDYDRDVVIRGGYLFDRDNNTDEFDAPITADIIKQVDFDDLPQVAAWYVVVRTTITTAPPPGEGQQVSSSVLTADLESAKTALIAYDRRFAGRVLPSEMLTSDGTLTLLQAVNAVLLYAQRDPVSQLRGHQDAVRAEHHLVVRRARTLGERWTWSSDIGETLSPDTDDDDRIAIGSNVVLVLGVGSDSGRRFVIRNGYLYDKDNRTYAFDRDITVDIWKNTGFQVMPQPAVDYLLLGAALDFVISDPKTVPALVRKLTQDLERARTVLEQFDATQRPGTLTTKNPHFYRLRGNRRRRSS